MTFVNIYIFILCYEDYPLNLDVEEDNILHDSRRFTQDISPKASGDRVYKFIGKFFSPHRIQ